MRRIRWIDGHWGSFWVNAERVEFGAAGMRSGLEAKILYGVRNPTSRPSWARLRSPAILDLSAVGQMQKAFNKLNIASLGKPSGGGQISIRHLDGNGPKIRAKQTETATLNPSSSSVGVLK
jgi:hypothetical protein